MEHFIAYHKSKKMGYEYNSTGELIFEAGKRKLKQLNKAIGNTVWVIQGISGSTKNAFTLCGAYLAESVEKKPSSDKYIIRGNRITEFSPPVLLNDLSWFPLFMKSQASFAAGFNRIGNESFINALTTLQSEINESPPSLLPLPEPNPPISATEGAKLFASHLRRERNSTITKAKKADTLNSKGSLCCEACGFDFSVVYGSLGLGFCEIHHLIPLSASNKSVSTTLDDLAVLCSNCHRIIHRSINRSTRMLSIADLSKIISRDNL